MKPLEPPYPVDETLLSFGAWISSTPCDEVLEFKKEFEVKKPLRRATLEISGLGFYEAFLNEKKVDDAYYKPFFTDYLPRDASKEPSLVVGNAYSINLLHNEVLSLLKQGKNVFRVLLGNGYFQNEERPFEPFRGAYGTKRLFYVLTLFYEDGSKETFGSDPTTLVRKTAILSGLYRGNAVDFTKNDGDFVPSMVLPSPSSSRLFYSDVALDHVEERLQPLRQERRGDTLFLDFGKNHSGGISCRLKGPRGTRIEIAHAEVLNPDGSLNMATSRYEEVDASGKLLDRIDQISHYTLSGGWDTIEPLFNWFCYRYVEIRGIQNVEIQNLESLFIHSAFPVVGTFSSSSPILNEIHDKSVLTFKDNLHAGILSDCPHREKRPYTGDGAIVEEAMLDVFDSVSFYKKWLKDILSSQRSDGFVPYTAPHIAGGGGYAWSMAIVDVPLHLFERTGEKSILLESLSGIEKWVGFLSKHADRGIVGTNGQVWLLGDWLTPEITVFNVPLMSSCCYYHSLDVLIHFLEILGEQEKLPALEKERQEVREAINSTFFDPKTGHYADGKQGEDVLPLYYGITEEKDVPALQEKIRGIYRGNRYHLDTGIVMTPKLLDYLFSHNMEEIALKILLNETYPSYAWMLQGETTLSEHWSKKWIDFKVGDRLIKGGGDLSHCHPMFGSVVDVLYKHLSGLDLSHLYEKKIVFSPKAVGLLESVSASHLLKEGRASISYQNKKEGGFAMDIEIPASWTGVLSFPSPDPRLILEESQEVLLAEDGWIRTTLSSGHYHLVEKKA